MRSKLIRLVAVAILLASCGCGAILDFRDSVNGLKGNYTPTGYYKRNFWGEREFHSYAGQEILAGRTPHTPYAATPNP